MKENLCHVTRTRTVRLCIFFGLQIQLDIHHILGGSPPCPNHIRIDPYSGLDATQELQVTSKQIKGMIAAHLHSHNEMDGQVHEDELDKT